MKVKKLIHSNIRHHRLKQIFVLALLLSAALITWWNLFLKTDVDSDDAYIAGNIIPVQALVSGVVARVYMDNTMLAHTGQILLSEERNLTSTQKDKAAANLAKAVRDTKSLFAQTEGQQADISVLNAKKSRLQADLIRYQHAFESGAVSSQQVTDTQADITILNQEIEKAKANLHKSNALVIGTQVNNNPVVQKARAEFVEAYIHDHRTNVYAPLTGYVANRRVQAGEQVKEGQQLLSIVPLDNLWITANIKETKLARVRTGEPVTIKTYTYGNDFTFHGKVLGIIPTGGSTFSLFPPNNSTGNYIHIIERIPVRISLLASELHSHPLRPGMSVSIHIDTRNYRRLNVLDTQVQTLDSSYATNIYETEIADAQRAAQAIIVKNDLSL
jgi:membrane fusion protein (multidrug efflux system)